MRKKEQEQEGADSLALGNPARRTATIRPTEYVVGGEPRKMVAPSLSKYSMMVKGAEIQRLWDLHEVLVGLDFTSEDNQPMVQQLLECFLRTNFIRSDDVRTLVFLTGRSQPQS